MSLGIRVTVAVNAGRATPADLAGDVGACTRNAMRDAVRIAA
jgi:hypothetical protein